MSERSNSDGLRGHVGRGAAWSALDAGVLKLSQFLVGVLIARLVSPRDFGVFVVALTIYTIVAYISDIGVTSAIIREKERSDEIGPTVTTIAIGTSLALAGMLFITAPYLSAALGSSAASGAVRVICLTVVLGGIGSVPGALLTRDFKQKQRFLGDLSSFVVANSVLIAMAVSGAGVMALAWSRVAGQLVSTVVYLVLARRWYWPGFNMAEARRLLRFGLPLASANLVWFSMENIDFLCIARIQGTVPLGYYNLAYNVSSWPRTIFGNVITTVTLPALSRVRDSKRQLHDHFTVAMAALAAMSFPVSALCLAVAHPLVMAVYGDKWAPAAAPLAILVVFGSTRAIIALICDLFVAVGSTGLLFILQIVWLAVLLPAMIFGVYYGGIAGAAWAHLIVATGLMVPVYLVVLRRQLLFPVRRLAGAVAPPLLVSTVAGALAHPVATMFHGPWTQLLMGTLTGVFVYLVLLGYWLLGLVHTLRGMYGRGRVAAGAGAHRRSGRSTAIRPTPRKTRPEGPRHAVGQVHSTSTVRMPPMADPKELPQ